MSESEQLSAALGEIYEAALDPSLWPSAMQLVCGFVGGYSANMFIHDSATKSGNFISTWGLDPDYWQTYVDKYVKINPAFPTMLLLDAGRVLSNNDVVPEARLHATRFYKEWLEPQGFVDCVGAILEKSWTSAAVFVIFRNKDQGMVDETVRRKMALLVPHIRRAVVIGKTIDLQSVTNANFANTLDALSTAVYLLSDSRHIIHANQSGISLRARADIFRATGDVLKACDPKIDGQLQEIFSAASIDEYFIDAKGTAVGLNGKDAERYIAHVLPLASKGRGRGFHAAAFAVFVHQAALQRPTLVEAVANRFRLTPAELRVLFAIIEVGGVPEIAPILGVSETTVKTHLKHLFAKTGTNRQADLVRLVAEFADPPIL
jgi:DNA-binding CsgD family transcriptional regulator